MPKLPVVGIDAKGDNDAGRRNSRGGSKPFAERRATLGRNLRACQLARFLCAADRVVYRSCENAKR